MYQLFREQRKELKLESLIDAYSWKLVQQESICLLRAPSTWVNFVLIRNLCISRKY